MKSASASCICAWCKTFFTLVPPLRLICGILIVTSFCPGIWGSKRSTAHAEARILKKNLSLLYYTNHLCPGWIEGGAFSQLLTQDVQKQQQSINYLTKQTNVELSNELNGLTKKILIAFSPRVVIKPFIIFEELQNAMFTYRSKNLEQNIPIDEKFQAKSTLLSNHVEKLKKIKKRKPFAFSPYYKRTYGLHLQIAW